MIVFHGSTVEVQEPKIIRSEYGRDFGFAFYTTDIQPQAERWAVRKARIKTRKLRRTIQAVVSVFDWDETSCAALSVKRFDAPDLEWLDTVARCRSDVSYRHEHDIVIGKIANDNVGETVSYVTQGIMRREDAVERLRFEKINNQLAFCTEAAIGTLRFVRSYVVEVP